MKQFKESTWSLSQEVIELKAKLSENAHQIDELMKENGNLKIEVASLHEHMDKIKEEAIEEFQVSQPYFNDMGGYYGNSFEDFCKQAVLMFLDLEFSQIQIKLNSLMTLVAEHVPDDVETNVEVVEMDRPGGVRTDEPKELNEQATDPVANP